MPYKSKAQAAYFNIHKGEMEAQGVNVDEWNSASRGKHLPKRALHGGTVGNALRTASKYAGGGAAFDAGGQATLRRYGRPNLQWDKDPKRAIEGSLKPYVLPEDEMAVSGGEWARRKPIPIELADGGDAEGESWEPPPEPFEAGYPEPTQTPVQKVDAVRAALRTANAGNKPIEPLPDGQQSLTAYHPSKREEFAQRLMGDNPSEYRRRLVTEGLGTTGIGEQHPGLIDLTPVGQALGVQENLQHGEPTQAALWALPGAGPLKGMAKTTGTTAREVEGLLKEFHATQSHKPIDIGGFEKVGGQKGSNPGGVYADPESGHQWYVKQPPTEDHVNNEKLANELYKLAGVPVPEVRITKLNGKPAIASRMIEGTPLNKAGMYSDDFSEFNNLHEHFPADAWLGNYDTIGMGKDNIIIDANNMAHRIDAGGALRYRAQGKPKLDFGPEVKELETMRDPKINPDASDVFKWGNQDLETLGAQRIANIPDEKIHALVEKYGPRTNSEDLYRTIIDRKNKIADHYGLGEKSTPPESGPTGSTKDELEDLIKKQKQDADEQEYWNAVDKQQNNEYMIGQGVHAEAGEGRHRRIAEKLKPLDWMSYKPKDMKLSPADIPHANPEELAQHGFNTSVPILHGSREHRGPFHELYDPAEKGTEKALFAAHDPKVAKTYANYGDKGPVDEEFMHQFLARPKKAAEVDWHDISGYHTYDPEAMHHLIETARKENLDLIAIHGIDDIGGGLQTQYAILNPEILRYPTAKFDPSKLHLRMPFAGLVGGGLFAYGTLRGQGEGKMKRGGSISSALRTAKKYAAGGNADSWMMHQSARNLHSQGMIKSGIPGRTDKLPMSVPSGAYVLPADIPSALGQGNSMAGGQILKKMFNSGPGGLPLGKGGGKPSMPRLNLSPKRPPKGIFADGGPPEDGDDSTVPIIAAGGEFIVHPDVVKDIGHGDLNAGHKVLDQFVLHTRAEHIKTLKNLKPPKK